MTRARWNSWAVSLLLTALLSLLIGKAVRADGPDSRLLRLVGSEAGLVIEVSDLRQNLPKMKNSEIFQRLRKTKMYHQWESSADFQGLVDAQKAIETLVEKPLEELMADLFGQSVTLAVYPSRTKGEPQTVLILRASSQETLTNALSAWNRAERSVSETIAYSGHTYIRRTKTGARHKKGSKTQFVVLFGDVMALSDSESIIRRVIELNRANQTDDDDAALGSDATAAAALQNFLSTAAFREAAKSLSPKRFVSLYLNPRKWDNAVRFDAEKSGVERLLADFWRRCDSIGFGLRVGAGDVILEMSAHYDRTGLPRRQLPAEEPHPGPPRFFNRVPRRAAVVVAGRNDLSGVAKFLIEQIPQKQRRDWRRLRQIGQGVLVGFDLFDDVLPAVGSNWGMYLVAGKEETSSRLLLEGLLAVGLPPTGQITRGKITLRDGLDNALKTTLHLLDGSDGVDSDQQDAVVRSEVKDGIRFGWLETDRPFRPAYALTDGHLLGGSSRGVIREFLAVKERGALGWHPEFRDRARNYFPNANQLLFVNVEELRKIAVRNPSRLTGRLAGSKSVDLNEAQRRLEQITDLLQVFDIAFIAGRVVGERVHVVSGIAVRHGASAVRP